MSPELRGIAEARQVERGPFVSQVNGCIVDEDLVAGGGNAARIAVPCPGDAEACVEIIKESVNRLLIPFNHLLRVLVQLLLDGLLLLRRHLPNVTFVNDQYFHNILYIDLTVLEDRDTRGVSLNSYSLYYYSHCDRLGELSLRSVPRPEIEKNAFIFGWFNVWAGTFAVAGGSSRTLREVLRERVEVSIEAFAAQWFQDNPGSQERQLSEEKCPDI